MKKLTYFILLLVLAAGVFWGCEEEDEEVKPEDENQQQSDDLSADDSLKLFIQSVMDYEKYYYWIDEMADASPDSFETANDYFQALLYDEVDKWSFITDVETFNQHYQEGKYKGLGIRMKFDAEGNLRVAMAYKNSPMGKKGVTRGYKILSINGVSAAEIKSNGLGGVLKETGNSMELVNLKGKTESITVDMEEVGEAAILRDSVYKRGDKNIGYFVFQNFIDPAEDALNQTFAEFAKNNVTDLVVDLRYNGGGKLSIASQMADLIAGKDAAGELFYKVIHNRFHTEMDSDNPYYFEKRSNTLDIERIVFITTSNSASASEAVINGLDISALESELDVKLVGSQTHGKPVGMYPFSTDQQPDFAHIGKIVAPVTFKGVNADGYGDYYEGIPVDAQRTDDLTHRFGHPEESCLREALFYIENGNFSTPAKAVRIPKQHIRYKGMRMEIGAY